MDSDSDDSFIECEAIGNPEFIDLNISYRFYSQIAVNHLHVRMGDCVRVQLDGGNKKSKDSHREIEEDHGFGVVLALFEDDEQVICRTTRLQRESR